MLVKTITALLLFTALSAHAVTEASTPENIIKAKTQNLMPSMTIDSVVPSGIPGLYAVTSGGNVLYMTADGRYLVQGEIYNVENPFDVKSITSDTRQVGAKRLMDTLKPADLIIYKAAQEKTYITVFTDIDCGYCRALQKEVPALNDAGITVRYAAFPRSDKGTHSYDKAISIWCSKDRKTSYSVAMTGAEPEAIACTTHPVDMEKALGEQLGVNGTPTIVFKNGRVVSGFMPAKELIEAVFKYGMK